MWMNIPGPGFGMKGAGGIPATAGPNSPGTLADDSGTGTVSWSNPSNASSSNNSYATAFFGFGAGGPSHYLKCTNFGFSIPAEATITGITVEIEKKDATSDGGTNEQARDNRVRLVKAGTIQSTDKAAGSTNWPQNDAYSTYGGSADLWSGTWTPSDINNSGFGVAISAKWEAFDPESANVTASIDHVRITINYTT